MPGQLLLDALVLGDLLLDTPVLGQMVLGEMMLGAPVVIPLAAVVRRGTDEVVEPAGAGAPHPPTTSATAIATASSGVAIARADIMPTNASPSVHRSRS